MNDFRKAAQQARGLLDQKEVLNRLGIARSTFYIMLGKGEFVQPIRLSARVHVWKETDIDDFIEQKIKERDQKKVAVLTVKQFHQSCRDIMRNVVSKEFPELTPEEQEKKAQKLLGAAAGWIGDVLPEDVKP